MKLIGIIGKSGSGKTTLSRMLKKDDRTAIIHLDKITSTNSITKRMPKTMAKNYSNNIGEQGITFNDRIMRLLYRIKRNKVLDKVYLSVLKIPREISIKKQIKRYKNEGKKCIIIERYHIGFTFNV